MLDTSLQAQGVLIDHAIDVSNLRPSTFKKAPDPSSAQALGSSRFMSGGVTFTGTTPLCPPDATGSITGRSITANFDGLPPITLPTPTTMPNLTVSEPCPAPR